MSVPSFAGHLPLPPPFRFPRYSPLRRFSRREHSAHDWRVEFVFALRDVAVVVLDANNERGQHTFFLEVLLCNGHGQDTFHALAISRLIAMAPHVPGEDANLIEVKR